MNIFHDELILKNLTWFSKKMTTFAVEKTNKSNKSTYHSIKRL